MSSSIFCRILPLWLILYNLYTFYSADPIDKCKPGGQHYDLLEEFVSIIGAPCKGGLKPAPDKIPTSIDCGH